MHTQKTGQYPHRRARPDRPRQLPRTKLLYGGAIGIAAVGAVALVLASVLGSKSSTKPAVAPAAATLVTDLPQQHGTALGSPSAPVTLVEYADLQCPFCGAWAREQLPTVVDELVQTGRVRIEFHGLSFVGPDSVTALAGALAAARQNRLWSFVESMYANQGQENTGWVNAQLDAAVAAAGLDRTRWEADRKSGAVLDKIDSLSAAAAAAGIQSTPSFAIGRTGSLPQVLDTHTLDAGALRSLVDRLAPQ